MEDIYYQLDDLRIMLESPYLSLEEKQNYIKDNLGENVDFDRVVQCIYDLPSKQILKLTMQLLSLVVNW